MTRLDFLKVRENLVFGNFVKTCGEQVTQKIHSKQNFLPGIAWDTPCMVCLTWSNNSNLLRISASILLETKDGPPGWFDEKFGFGELGNCNGEEVPWCWLATAADTPLLWFNIFSICFWTAVKVNHCKKENGFFDKRQYFKLLKISDHSFQISFLLSFWRKTSEIFRSFFLGELKKPKSPFEINWPLGRWSKKSKILST